MVIILSSIINTFKRGRGGDIFDHLTSMKIFTLIINKIII